MSESIQTLLFPPNIKRSKELVQYNAPYSHILVVLNKRSGGWQAVGLEKIFYRLVGRQNVVDITEINDVQHLSEKLKHLIGRKDVKVIAGCGDGTMASIFALLDLLGLTGAPLAPLALGTGNELSGISGWGRAYVGEPIEDFVENVDHGRVLNVDRWNIEFKNKKHTPNRISENDLRVTSWFSIVPHGAILVQQHVLIA
eukprot:TRINITY_DN1507_c0_g6_i1.p1 TRINITY_DN1507_c0_g6~~TRINITY_DN1507_c0_g6_i1.p1  ORF type:complete len:199 (+),score=29.18 TRINITY_DN1507_c0_g6_i1:53-649(+)